MENSRYPHRLPPDARKPPTIIAAPATTPNTRPHLVIATPIVRGAYHAPPCCSFKFGSRVGADRAVLHTHYARADPRRHDVIVPGRDVEDSTVMAARARDFERPDPEIAHIAERRWLNGSSVAFGFHGEPPASREAGPSLV
jgi:hypothetical protein